MDRGVGTDIYKILLLLHIVTVVVGFGSVALNGVYAARAKKAGGREGVAVAEANTWVSEKVAEPFIYAVPIFGILLVVWSKDVYGFDQAWISLSFLLYIVGLAVAHAVVRPGARRMNALTAQLAASPGASPSGPPPEVAEVEALEKRLALGGAVLNVLVVVIIILMIWKPGY
jgi:uncharacterized membrane protein